MTAILPKLSAFSYRPSAARLAAPDRKAARSAAAESREPKAESVRYTAPMPVDPELLEILACPACKTPVRLVKDGAALKCDACHRVYPIKDDIPVMLIDEATVEP
jgi:uncharacterized protein